MTLNEAECGKIYVISDVVTNDVEMDSFLFTLGCFSGEEIRVISHLSGGPVIYIKDSRYQIDRQLANAILV